MAHLGLADGSQLMGTAAVPTRATVGLGRRLILGMAASSLLVVFTASAWSFAWPGPSARGEYAIGPIERFEPGSVTSYLFVDGALRELPLGLDYDRRPPGYPTIGTELFYVVRLPNDEFRVFSGAAPFRGSTVVWYQRDEGIGEQDGWVGLFAEGRRGTRWTIDGTRVFGPAPRALDQYAFRVRADGMLVVDLSDLTQGVSSSSELPPPYDVTSDDWPTSGWPSR